MNQLNHQNFQRLSPNSQLSTRDRQLAAYSYDLPEALIAQNPVTPRDSAKLLVVESQETCQHRHFRDLSDLLLPGDLLILNNTRVIPARLCGTKHSGGAAEVLLIEPVATDRWLALVKPGRRLQPGSKIEFGNGAGTVMTALVEAHDPATNGRILKLTTHNGQPVDELIEQLGQVPLPPYITQTESLPEQYQTVFAQRRGAIAAPTAGLHFTEQLLAGLADKGIQTAEVTLHVGIGTFRPVEVTDIETHTMHQERIEVGAATVEKIQQTKASGGRVIAVGTTSTRALEGTVAACGQLQPYSGKTDLFIYPGYRWQVIDGLITNFHLPGSSLLMMVSALIGRERLMQLYEEAIARQYRFYSFGDAMIVLPEAVPKDQP
ncbi:tRNA preQ1(34) S-adenosylmethionine ribosyltransferase-isomerase QueA [Leptolyngbya sp. BC1307]|uniref:tRNA preQ1(34) S-adenosylmethionine ribosyltransferase-isomerase QueA n=1 Tax=Leptolyngbya sp. BC1307 TaxID=2029589 RepID=UPI000EFB328B|nr:tRNA preQ1(34) S-adenosylmethionine ribosyltransferase-isomerase QueA [Leptolyngbya sp. BC1307]